MSVLIYIEGLNGEIKKSSIEAIAYGVRLAVMQNTDAVGVLIGKYSAEVIESIQGYGLKKILHIQDAKLDLPLTLPYTTVLSEAAKKENSNVIVMAKSAISDGIASRLGVRLNAGVATNVIEIPDLNDGFKVKRPIYSGKAFTYVGINSAIKILTIAKNAFPAEMTEGKAEVESFSPAINEADFNVKTTDVQKASGDVLLTEADIVVSGGRGLKGPENWNILLDLARELGAATGCSKPVSDLDWRPHHEHVGQTGVKVSPNLYIALGISGAIQHLAGVNSSKVIVVINKDPEAPFFKAADYGIVGDIFEIVPKLTAAAKALK